MLSNVDFKVGLFASGLKSATLGIFIVIFDEPISQHIISNRLWMIRLELAHRHLLIPAPSHHRNAQRSSNAVSASRGYCLAISSGRSRQRPASDWWLRDTW